MPTPRSTYTPADLAQIARDHARTHRGETPLEWHLRQWAEEASNSDDDNQFMLEVAAILVNG